MKATTVTPKFKTPIIMQAAAHTKAPSAYYYHVETTKGLFKDFSILDMNKISNKKKIYDLATDLASVNMSKKLLADFRLIINDKLNSAHLNIQAAKKNLEQIHKSILGINVFFENINNAIGCQYSEVEIDDKNMKALIGNMELIKDSALYVKDYLNLVIEIDSFNNSDKIKCTVSEFIEKIELAA